MKKNIFRAIGFVLIIIGIFLVIIQPLSPTGAVIDFSTTLSKINFFIGLVLIIIGAGIISVSLESVVQQKKEVFIRKEKQQVKDFQLNDRKKYIKRNIPGYLRNYRPGLLYYLVKLFGKLQLRGRVYGKKKVPKGPKLFIVNHPTFFGQAQNLISAIGEPVHIVTGQIINYSNPLKAIFLRPMGSVPVVESFSNLKSKGQVEQAIQGAPFLERKSYRKVAKRDKKYHMKNKGYFRTMASLLMQGKNVAIYAEGSLFRGVKDDKREAYAGYAAIAREYERQTGKKIPIVPVGMVPTFGGGKAVFGDYFYIDENGKQSKKELKTIATQKIHGLVDHLKKSKR